LNYLCGQELLRLQKALALTLACFVASTLFAAVPSAPKYAFRMWQTDDGLPHNAVLALARTSDGYLWVGTQEGLAIFNGVTFTVLRHQSASHLEHGRVSALCTAPDGALWIGCDGFGVTSFHNGSFKHLTLSNGLAGAEIHCFLPDRSGGMWIGTETGLTRYHEGKTRNYTIETGLGDNSVRALAFDSSGNLQIATKRGLTSIAPDGSSTTRLFPGRWNANALRAVATDRSGDLWVGATDGLYRLFGTNCIAYNIADGLPDRIINSICLSHRGELWVGTYGGLAKVADGSLGRSGIAKSVPEDMVNVIIEDQERNIWAGTRDGLLRLSASRFTTYTTKEGLSGNNVMSVLEDSQGTMWLGVWGGGLNAMRDGEVEVLRNTADIARDSVLSLLQSRTGTLWVGMDFELGLNAVTNNVRVPVELPLPGGPIRVLHEDEQGALWIGAEQGLSVIKGSEAAIYTNTNGLPGNRVRVVCQGGPDTVWVGTDQGLTRLQNGSMRTWRKEDGLRHNAVNALCMDDEGCLWIGTLGGGLNCLKDGALYGWGRSDGLFSDEIYEILEDRSRFLWMSCRRGLFRVSKRQLWEYLDGRVGRVGSIAFDKSDGLLSVQFNGVAKPAGWKDKSGKLWFASIRGVVEVDASIPPNQRPPEVVIERVLAGRKQLWPPQVLTGTANASVTIPPGAGEIEIHYAALSLSAPEKNKFAYKLEKASSAWSPAESQQTARYNNLSPGRHVFRVIACNNDGVWNEEGASLTLAVLPQFWQTWWFKVLVAIPLIGIGWVAYHLRVSRLRGLEALRMRIAANLHDEVGARLTKVAMITEQVSQQLPQAHPSKSRVDEISRATSEVTKAMDEVVWTINPKNDTLENFANYMFHYALEYFQDTRIRCLVDLPTQLPERELPTETRHNLFMVMKEALNNVLKHSAATEIRIGLHTNDHGLSIEVRDNGCGFSAEQARKPTEGLRNMRRRMDSLGGSTTWESTPSTGTIVRIELPWPSRIKLLGI
jgi:ligand-binding sensor domain-containing protein/two-component sensor histidine kinase